MLDLIIHDGRVIDWKNHIDRVTDIGIKDGLIVSTNAYGLNAKNFVDASNLIVVPGIIDSHMHASSWLGGPEAYQMLAVAGVTSAFEMAGPLNSVKKYVKKHGTGINIGSFEQIKPGVNVKTAAPSIDEIISVSSQAISDGAYGIKILGGHYPLTPEATSSIIKISFRNNIYCAIHAGSTENGSNIKGMSELIEIAENTPFHLAHINAYCRGAVFPVLQEVSIAEDLLNNHPEIVCESYLSPINGCSGKCNSGVPESGVTRNCLLSKGYPATEEGLRKAIKEGQAIVHVAKQGVIELSEPTEGLELWEKSFTDTPLSFNVNPALPRFHFATAKRQNSSFLVDAFCTDGGGIPRNVIISSGLSLVKLGALSLEEFVLKSSYSSAQFYGLTNKGHLSEGADGDITIIDLERQTPIFSFVKGKKILDKGKVVGQGGSMITSKQGERSILSSGLEAITVDTEILLRNRTHRFIPTSH